jgi:hypothetical protein
MPLDLSREQRAALKRAATNGDYHLLLGAGASLDSLGPDGRRLPGSRGLIEELGVEFGVPFEADDLLWRIYDRAVEVAGADRVYQWLRAKFWGVRPPDWMSYYARSPWAAVWTLNVDDSFEAAYRGIATNETRPMTTVNWDSDYQFGRALNVVHLHGAVNTDHPRKLVFSLSEYAGSSAARAAWPLNFRDSYGNAPFVVIGARLRDEPDIEAVVSGRRPAHAAPSFYVSTSISEAVARDMERWNLTPVQMSAEDFVLEWAEMTGLSLTHTPTAEAEIGLRVGQQLRELKRAAGARTPKGHDFLGGDEPLWSDVTSGLVARTDWIRQADADCAQVGASIPKSTILAFVGRRLTGRSAGLLAIAETLQSQSWRTFVFEGGGRPDIEAIRKFAADGKSIAVLFDGFAEIADDLEVLVAECRAAGLSLLCVGVEDDDREASILGRISQTYLARGRIASINPRLTRTDAGRLVDLLGSVGRLGFLEAEKDSRRLAHFKGLGIFDAMAQLENAPGFGRRVDELVGALTNELHVQIVMLAAFASKVGQKLLAIDAARMTGLDSDVLIATVQSDPALKTLVSTDGQVVRTRQRWLALDSSIARLGSSAALEFLAEALRRAAPRLSRASQRERNATAVLVGSIMSQRNLRAIFPGSDLEHWYEGLLDVFGQWSGRYWEQRAIVARRQGEGDPRALARAESFAIRASELISDSYSLTTLGTVLLAKAAFAPGVDADAYYERAQRTFERAMGADTASNMVGWFAYLSHSLPVLRRALRDEAHGGPLGAEGLSTLSQKVAGDWARVHRQLSVIAKGTDRTSRELLSLKQEFAHIVGNGPDSGVAGSPSDVAQ